MSRMLELINAHIAQQQETLIWIPGEGFREGTVESVADDVVIIVTNDGRRVVMHYTQFAYRTR